MSETFIFKRPISSHDVYDEMLRFMLGNHSFLLCFEFCTR